MPSHIGVDQELSCRELGSATRKQARPVRPCPGRGAVDTRRGSYTFSRDDVVGDARNHDGDGHDGARCESTEATNTPLGSRVRENARPRVRERVPDGLRPDALYRRLTSSRAGCRALQLYRTTALYSSTALQRSTLYILYTLPQVRTGLCPVLCEGRAL